MILKRFNLYFLVFLMIVLQSCQSFKKKGSSSQSSYINNSNKPDWASKKFDYHPSNTLLFNLLHTKLDLVPDFKKQYLYGEARLTLKPYYYPQKSLVLDAKGFEILDLGIVKDTSFQKANYTYNSKKINISLNKTYTKKDTLVIYIKYIAKPNELVEVAGTAIHSDKGLYFINPLGDDPEKPTQLWTQGEPESSSCWFPTIDAPNTKCTQEIAITVDKKYKTLSNGDLIFSTFNAGGTRTDLWKQDKAHSPYLFMMAVGDFAIVKDTCGDLLVDYYVEPKFEKHALATFKNTPEMIKFFSKKFKYNYPWDKYSSIVVRDYVSGAMENTSATVFMDALQQTRREAIDKNWDFIIAHELSHHWFGDLVTAESWANLPLNESFATYSEYLWTEYKQGKEEADDHNMGEIDQYLEESKTKQEPLFRPFYKSKDDMFDSHSYAKGGAILHMLRKQIGDSAFFDGISRYLWQNRYKPAEVAHLRLALEETTGQDLNWFFNQWFLSPGHPQLVVKDKYEYGKLKLEISQKQDSAYSPIFKIQTKIKVGFEDGSTKEIDLEINKQQNSYEFELPNKPTFVCFDPEKIIVGEINHDKTIKQYIAQYQACKELGARIESIDWLQTSMDSSSARKVIISAMNNDTFWAIREKCLRVLAEYKGKDTALVTKAILELIEKETKNKVKGFAIEYLSLKHRPEYSTIYNKAYKDSSYVLVAASLAAFRNSNDSTLELKISQNENSDIREIIGAVAQHYSKSKSKNKYNWFESKIKQVSGRTQYTLINNLGKYLASADTSEQRKAIPFLGDLAKNSKIEWIRFTSYRALGEIKNNTSVTTLRKEIKEAEKSEKLIKMYKDLK